jgi:hypothetical protein
MAELHIDRTALQNDVMPKLEVFARAFIDRVVTQAKQLAPERSGNLKRLIVPDAVRRVGPWSLEGGVSVLANYAAPVHEGARPHVIRPKNARALRFEVEGGRVVFARRVNHPGNRANPFLRNAVHRVASADPRITVGER